MNLYEAIFVRKTVRKYKTEPLEQSTLDNIMDFADNTLKLFEGIIVEYKIMNHSDMKKNFSGALTYRAPHYLTLYSENVSGYQMNAGYLLQQISLYLTAKGIGSCYLGMLKPKKVKQDGSKLEYVITLAFGKAENEVYRSSDKAKRLPMDDIAIFKSEVNRNIKTMIQAARLSPSSMNSQPWRLVVYDNRIHIFCKKNMFLNGVLNEIKLIDIGICLAHLLVTAEELWVDVKVIHLDNISSIAFKKNDYVISIKVC
ncbi:nitroreductase family protein [Anaerocolumna sp. MB42-C2]|uniref:nitroreductase family protein n=1 Tax=Anaerocolumna sp. MB42-C2 TaxID=3070997 RepID=UPI0027DEC44E|nr:nitroreductase family protein [Anaerocolumna sp. MB42-C2]WMJ87385.1 nitroreductase family protein [Anaerocolumna sp. MB42-C2]